MTFAIHGLAVSRGVAIGRAVLVASSRVDVAHYFVEAHEVDAEIERVRLGRDLVVEEIHRLQESITHMGPKEAPHELSALLDVHLMLLQDGELIAGVKHWITERLYNGEWALTTQLEVIARQFDEMEDEYLRERKADMEQIVERVLRAMKGVGPSIVAHHHQQRQARKPSQQDLLLDDRADQGLHIGMHLAIRIGVKTVAAAQAEHFVPGRRQGLRVQAFDLGIEAVKLLRESPGLFRQRLAVPGAEVGANIEFGLVRALKGEQPVMQRVVVDKIFFSAGDALLITDLEKTFIRVNQRGKTGLADVDPQLHAAVPELFEQMANAAHKVTQPGRAVDPLMGRFVGLDDSLHFADC